MFGLSPMELLVIGAIAILLFGNKLPEVAKSVGKGLNEFKRGMSGIEDELHSATRATSTPAPRSSSRPSRPIEDREEATAPKFDPPPAEGAA
jgi:sec-independent protein translocase protein TatA